VSTGTLAPEMRHAQELLLRGRCPACAEHLPPLTLLRGEPCPRCDGGTRADGGEEDLEAWLAERWRRRAWIAVGVVGTACLVGGYLPLLQTPLFFVGTLLAHVWVVRSALGWLTPARAAFARLTLSLLLAALGVVDALVAVAVMPLPIASGPVLGFTGAAGIALYLACARRLILARLVLDRQGARLQVAEWGLPIGVLVAFAASMLAALTLLVLLLRWISELAPLRWLADLLGGAA
jgi:hypothetical protein